MQNLSVSDEVMINSGLYQGQFAVVVKWESIFDGVVSVRLRSGTIVQCNKKDLRLFSLPNSKAPEHIEEAIKKQIESDSPKRKKSGRK